VKVAHILPTLGYGGAERIVIELARCTALAGHDVTIFVGWQLAKEQQPPLSRLPKCVTITPIARRRMLAPARYIGAAFWTWSNRRELQAFNVLHCHLTLGGFVGFLLFIYRKLTHARTPRIIETYHAVGMPIPRINRWVQARMAIRRDALVLMAEDPYWNRFAERHPDLLVRMITNGAADPGVTEITPADRLVHRRMVGIPDECRFVVGTVGVLRRDRQPWLYVPIFAELARIFGSSIHFVVAGGGPERKRLESLISAEGLSCCVHITGPITDPRTALSAMDLYLTMNVGPFSGVAAMEAALAGIPAVAIQMRRPYRPQKEDWIWSSADLPEVAHRAADLLRSKTDRIELSARQQLYARKNHTIEQMCNSYQRLYSAVLEG
jgi:glycosyltransferase involved in cell wall biosynthesis